MINHGVRKYYWCLFFAFILILVLNFVGGDTIIDEKPEKKPKQHHVKRKHPPHRYPHTQTTLHKQIMGNFTSSFSQYNPDDSTQKFAATSVHVTANTSYHVVVSQPRSGSTFISQVMGAHPCIVNVEEAITLFKADLKAYRPDRASVFHSQLVQTALRRSSEKVQRCNEHVGIGWKQFIADHATSPPTFRFNDNGVPELSILPTFLKTTGTRVVLFMRRNLLEYHVSRGFTMPKLTHKLPQHCGANQTRCDSSRKELENKRAKLDFVKLRRFIISHGELQRQAYRAFSKMAEEHGVKVLYVPYEAVVADHDAASAKLIDFLGFQPPPHRLEAKVEKRFRLQFDQFFTNWHLVSAELESICGGCSIYSKPGIEGVFESERSIHLL